MHRSCLLLLVACSSSPSSTTTPVATTTAPADAAVDAAPPPDAPSATDGELASAEPHVFRFNIPPRVETWTLRIAGTRASIVVAAENETVYTGSFIDGNVQVSTSTAKLSLACKRDKLADVGEPGAVPKLAKQRCTFAKTSTVDIWSCKVPGYEAPMPFAAAPGIEFTIEGSACTHGAYRRIAP